MGRRPEARRSFHVELTSEEVEEIKFLLKSFPRILIVEKYDIDYYMLYKIIDEEPPPYYKQWKLFGVEGRNQKHPARRTPLRRKQAPRQKKATRVSEPKASTRAFGPRKKNLPDLTAPSVLAGTGNSSSND